MRNNRKPFEPLDLESRDEFFFDINTEKIYKYAKEIDADEMLLEIYNKHIKTTYLLHGCVLRLKLRFWRVLLPWLFIFISKTSLFLWILSLRMKFLVASGTLLRHGA